jgi:hypothetical protein
MGSHQDIDSPIDAKRLREMFETEKTEGVAKSIERLEKRAMELSDQGKNIITAGMDGEMLLFEARRNGFLIRRLPDDPDRVLRASVGAPTFDDQQAYLVIRGNPVQLYDLLRKATKALGNCLGEMQRGARGGEEETG